MSKNIQATISAMTILLIHDQYSNNFNNLIINAINLLQFVL